MRTLPPQKMGVCGTCAPSDTGVSPATALLKTLPYPSRFMSRTDDPVTDRYRSFYANIQRPWPGQRLTRNPDWTTESRHNGGSAQPDTGGTPVSPRAPATLSATLRAAAIRERLTAHRARRSADRSGAC